MNLIEIYHHLFDLKDQAESYTWPNGTGGQVRYAAYEAIQKIETLMRLMGQEPPKRYDGEGRDDLAGTVQCRAEG